MPLQQAQYLFGYFGSAICASPPPAAIVDKSCHINRMGENSQLMFPPARRRGGGQKERRGRKRGNRRFRPSAKPGFCPLKK
jgi:hypothetical protein